MYKIRGKCCVGSDLECDADGLVQGAIE